MSRPPPGYLPTGQRLSGPGAAAPMASGPPPSGKPGGLSLVPMQMLQQHQQPTTDHESQPDKPEEGRLVRVGNMLQIVPDEHTKGEKVPAGPVPVPAPSSSSAAVPTAAAILAAAAAASAASSGSSAASPSASAHDKPATDATAQSILKRMEEMKKKNQKKELERKLKREQRRQVRFFYIA